jgi:anion-transporting  ArsA/GET3 family ATPase
LVTQSEEKDDEEFWDEVVRQMPIVEQDSRDMEQDNTTNDDEAFWDEVVRQMPLIEGNRDLEQVYKDEDDEAFGDEVVRRMELMEEEMEIDEWCRQLPTSLVSPVINTSKSDREQEL